MTTFPAANYLTDASRTEGEFKSSLEAFLAGTKELPGASAESTLTISTGSITPTLGIHTVDTEGAGATDDLTNIVQTNHPDGRLLLIRCANAGRVVVVKHSAGGTGQISLRGAADFTLNNTAAWLLLKRTGALWEQIMPIDTATPTANAGVIADAAGYLDAWTRKGHGTIINGRIVASVGSNALTVALKGNDGNDPSASNPVYIVFRSSTLTSGAYVVRTITSALSVVISSGSTLGTSNGVAAKLVVWAIDNAGTVELAVSNGSILHTTDIISTTAEGGAGAANSAGVAYSTTARSNVACMRLGTIDSTQATAGTWASAVTSVTMGGPEPGRKDGAAQTAGFLGELITTSAGSPVSGSSGVWNDAGVAGTTVPPGIWLLFGSCAFAPNTTYPTYEYQVAIGTTTGHSTSGIVTNNRSGLNAVLGGPLNGSSYLSVPPWPININVPTTYYLKSEAIFTGTITMQGIFAALRIG